MPPNKAPVNAVGGTQSDGPWPSEVDEIVEGNSYTRSVRLSDGSVQDIQVTVTRIVRHGIREDSDEDGYSVAYQFTDPTLGGGA